jgi:hypothetical protein
LSILPIKFYVPRDLQNIDRTETGSATLFYTHVEQIYSLLACSSEWKDCSFCCGSISIFIRMEVVELV